MADRFDVAQALGDCTAARAELWEFIRAFSQAWAVPLSPSDGFTARELRRAEDRLGARLPTALREAYLLFGRRSDLVAVQNPLLEPDELLLDPSGELLVFRSENQGCAGWGIPLTELSSDDPSVFLFSDHLPPFSREPFLDRVSLACVETVLSEAIMSRKERLGRECPATPEVVAAVEATFASVGLPPYPQWYNPSGAQTRWLSAPGKVLCLEPVGTGSARTLVVASGSERDLREVIAAIPGTWAETAPVAQGHTEGRLDETLPF